MVIYVCKEVPLEAQVVWKSALTMNGAQFVITCGIQLMQELYANN